ncbi:MAG TPA: hypothetical protein VKC57_15695 [Ktedonobacterales bacterium]|nr:hypothetical protein [Ktedonobacterales bacterium]
MALALFVGLFAIYNANGRELQPVDSQPTRLAARALARDGVLTLDRDIAEKPGLAQRLAFQKDLRGHTRSAYSVVPSIIAAVPAWILSRMGVVDLDAPLAPNLIAVLAASLLTAAAVVLVFLTLIRLVPLRAALYTAIGLGLGTNYWPMLSRTLWQHETVAFGVALALWAWLRPTRSLTAAHFVIAGAGLALALTCRLQVAPLAAILLLGMWVRAGLSRALLAGAIVSAATLTLFAAQYRWFGHVLGGFSAMQAVALQPDAHGVTSSLSHQPWIGAAGLLVSPSRGILIFSPVVLLALAGVRRSLSGPRDLRLGWLLGASGALFVVYGSYSVWWGGFTFGPRYMLDLLVPLTPAAAFGVEAALSRAWSQWLSAALLAWSVAVAATGAFMYPNDAWNTSPASVDTHHERLWDWRDMQIVRAWERGPSPQNFDLFQRASLRRPDAPR